MKIYSESIPLQSSKPREAINIHSRVKAAVEKSGFRDGICLVSSLSGDSALMLLERDSDFSREFDGWLEQLSSDPQNQTSIVGSNFPIGLQSLLLGRQLTIPFSEGRLDIGSSEAVFFIEFNGIRPRRVVVKILGE
jgi:secondary thiamine-phosphate synthase enzyme